VPPPLKDVTLRALDIGLLQAGASVKGEFEKRLRQVIDEVQSSPKPIILFIDEAHTLIGAGGQAGTGDAANLLKPALARGRCAPSPPRPGPNTGNISRRTRR
jgi:type VI secretion system protein VasG